MKMLRFLLKLLFSISFHYDQLNPYRRWCKRCGQCQYQYHYGFASHMYWWEDVGVVPNKRCACHRHATVVKARRKALDDAVSNYVAEKTS